MKIKNILYAVAFILSLCSCTEETLPHPAINFTDKPATLKKIEENKLIEERIARNDPTWNVDAKSYRERWEIYKYLTENSDTITYWYMKDQVFDVLVQMPNVTLEDLEKRIKKELDIESNGNGIYYTNDFYVKIGKDGNNKGCYILYFYPSDEIRKTFDVIFNSSSSFGYEGVADDYMKHMKNCSGDVFQVQVCLGLAGMASVTGPIGYYSKLLYD